MMLVNHGYKHRELNILCFRSLTSLFHQETTIYFLWLISYFTYCWLKHLSIWLVVWNMFYSIFPYIGNVIIPTDLNSIISQRGRAQPPTSHRLHDTSWCQRNMSNRWLPPLWHWRPSALAPGSRGWQPSWRGKGWWWSAAMVGFEPETDGKWWENDGKTGNSNMKTMGIRSEKWWEHGQIWWLITL